MLVTSVEAVTRGFRWNGLNGYSVTGTYTYDDTIDGRMIREKGKGKTNRLQSLKVSFYNSSGKLLYDREDIIDGESLGKYFEFNLDTATQQLFGSIDVGGENYGELFLKGRIDDGLSLIKIDSSGKEYLLDSDK